PGRGGGGAPAPPQDQLHPAAVPARLLPHDPVRLAAAPRRPLRDATHPRPPPGPPPQRHGRARARRRHRRRPPPPRPAPPRPIASAVLGACIAGYEQWLADEGADLQELLDRALRELAAGFGRLG